MNLCRHNDGTTHMKHSFRKVSVGPKMILYRCSECGKGTRRYRPGRKPAKETGSIARLPKRGRTGGVRIRYPL